MKNKKKVLNRRRFGKRRRLFEEEEKKWERIRKFEEEIEREKKDDRLEARVSFASYIICKVRVTFRANGTWKERAFYLLEINEMRFQEMKLEIEQKKGKGKYEQNW